MYAFLQAVKSLGATLRTFSPTIRELASVTNDLSSTLQEQIGLDDIRNEFRNPPPSYYRCSLCTIGHHCIADLKACQHELQGAEFVTPHVSSPMRQELPDMPFDSHRNTDTDEPSTSSTDQEGSTKASSTDAEDLPTEDLEAKIEESKRMAWGGQSPQSSPGTGPEAAKPSASQTSERGESLKAASDLSIEELEAELERRRSATSK